MAKDGMSEAPGQVTFPGDASKGYVTDSPKNFYPKMMNDTVRDYVEGEGSMGFERNQGAVRSRWTPPEAEGGTQGQKVWAKKRINGTAGAY